MRLLCGKPSPFIAVQVRDTGDNSIVVLILTDVQQPVFCKHFEMIPVKTSILDPAGYSVFKEICFLSRCAAAHFVTRRRIVPVVFHNKTDPKRLQIARDLKPERQLCACFDGTLR